MSRTKILAFLGKGGVGKTVLSALAGKVCIEKGLRVLFIDADPAMGLANALDIDRFVTIGQAREEIISKAKDSKTDKKKEDLSLSLDYLLMEALYEEEKFGLLVMGYTETLGCFCPLNTLLRKTIKSIASQFDVLVIDAEAGIEQVNRQVINSVQFPIVVSNNSVRGLKTALMIISMMDKVPGLVPTKTGVVFNAVSSADTNLCDMLAESGAENLGLVRRDENVALADLRGDSLLALDGNSAAMNDVAAFLERLNIF
ncbi:MAG: AAA family ATPase [Deltaproteobacteria bacterium]|nr:AAA family ATPase [Deltaproteobacteria bacterium]